jgi:hypothetical protein
VVSERSRGGVLVASNEASCHICRRFREFGRPILAGQPVLSSLQARVIFCYALSIEEYMARKAKDEWVEKSSSACRLKQYCF